MSAVQTPNGASPANPGQMFSTENHQEVSAAQVPEHTRQAAPNKRPNLNRGMSRRKEHFTMSTPTNEIPEEIRRAMRIRFDEVNKAAEERHQLRRDAGNREAAEENRRWVRRDADIADVDEK